jgi:hypothetical protein
MSGIFIIGREGLRLVEAVEELPLHVVAFMADKGTALA